MLDRFFLKFFDTIDNILSWIERYAVQLTSWLWQTRVKNIKEEKKKMRQAILQALEDKYNAQISEADATIKIYLDHSVGIGEHPQHIEEIDKLLQKIVDAQEKIKELQAFKL